MLHWFPSWPLSVIGRTEKIRFFCFRGCKQINVVVENNKTDYLRAFARKFFNIDFFLKILPLKDDELVMSEMWKNGGSPTLFLREHARKNTYIWVTRALLAKKAIVATSPKILQLELWMKMLSAKYGLNGPIKRI